MARPGALHAQSNGGEGPLRESAPWSISQRKIVVSSFSGKHFPHHAPDNGPGKSAALQQADDAALLSHPVMLLQTPKVLLGQRQRRAEFFLRIVCHGRFDQFVGDSFGAQFLTQSCDASRTTRASLRDPERDEGTIVHVAERSEFGHHFLDDGVPEAFLSQSAGKFRLTPRTRCEQSQCSLYRFLDSCRMLQARSSLRRENFTGPHTEFADP
jgi:hypothetical protein